MNTFRFYRECSRCLHILNERIQVPQGEFPKKVVEELTKVGADVNVETVNANNKTIFAEQSGYFDQLIEELKWKWIATASPFIAAILGAILELLLTRCFGL